MAHRGSIRKSGISLAQRQSLVLQQKHLLRLSQALCSRGPLAIFAFVHGIDREIGVPDLTRRLEKCIDAEPASVALGEAVLRGNIGRTPR
jgi:hypothetical protein